MFLENDETSLRLDRITLLSASVEDDRRNNFGWMVVQLRMVL